MNIADISKIQSLVNSSKLLTPKERDEWLELLDLMNDKQLTELQRILQPEIGRSDKSESQKSEVGSGTLSAAPAFERKGVEPQAQMPKLSHIMNLPTVARFNPMQHAAQPPAQPKPEQKPSPFASKLKSMFAEKELPAGHPEEELELAAGKPQAPKSEPVKIPEQKLPPPVLKTAPSRPVLFDLKVPIPPKPKAPAPVLTKLSQVPKVAPAAEKTEEVLDHALGLKPKAPAMEPVVIKPLPKMPEPVVSPVKLPQVEQKSAPELKAAKTDAAVTINISTLDDLAVLQSDVLTSSSQEGLIKKVRQLISQYGYFEAIFRIEKSPVYKKYLATGLKMLTDGASFENSSPSAEFLTKSQFEQLSDLLAKIQAS